MNNKLVRSDLHLLECWKEIRNHRLSNNKDELPLSFRRFTKAIANLIINDRQVLERMLNAEIENDRRKNG